ncbi:DEKNAAC100969 [Brettanomyces naardenensis]|uniref:DEKNAAC100969 n=1 Tax=Brettanomyces naardenensis TaxID=13370 RepID=A0A448YH43_BRENA|nr:DEKNAAC100969 [Brettanomyces naardenensis]
MPSSISDAFIVTSLPRLPAKADLSKLCTVPKIGSSSSSTFDMGVSGSFLGTFVTRPSPHMIWSYALSPQSIVNAMDSYTFEETDSSSERRLFAVSLTERKKHILKFITYGTKEDTEKETSGNSERSTTASIDDDTTVEPLREVKTKEIRLQKEVIGLEISSDGSRVVTLNEDGEISVWQFNAEDKPLFSSRISKNIKSGILFHQFLSPSDLQIQKDPTVSMVILFVEKDSKTSALSNHLCAITPDNILELATSPIDGLTTSNPLKFAFDPSGKLLILEDSPEMDLHVYGLPYTSEIKTISNLSNVFSHEPLDAPISLLPVSTNRILVSKNSTLALIDIQYEAVLSSCDLYPRAKESNGNAKPPRSITLLRSVVVKGNTLRTKETFALLLLKNSRDNNAVLDHLSLDVGLGKLSDVLGKGLHSEEGKKFVGLPLLVTGTEFESTAKDSAGLLSRSNEASGKLVKVYSQMEKLRKLGKLEDLESYVVSFLKMSKAAESGENFVVPESWNENKGLRVYEVEKDRIVDPEFIRKVTLLLFDKGEGDNCIALSEEFIPERALTYLLTHPLFPKHLTPGLLNVLSASSPRLMRQAIVTCPNIPCGDLIEQLSLVESEDVFKDLVARLIDEFSSERITTETVDLLKKQSSHSSGNVNLDRIIQKILKLNYGYEILNSFIDSNGLVLSLHYSKNETELSKLMTKAQEKIDNLKQNSELLSLVDQTLISADIEGDKKRGKKKEIRGTTIIEREDSKMDSMLRIVNRQTSGSRAVVIDKTVPVYSIERLAI